LQQYFIIFVGTIFPIILNTVAGVTSIDPLLKRAALCLGAGPKAMFRLMLHGAAPGIFVGIRTSLAFGWFIIVASEMVSASSGLGFIINEARTAMVTERLYVGMFMIGMIGFVQDRLLLLIREKLLPWV
jgi:ABC-type nitrate/sulfonate/bicarbonate transport system permease component